MGVKISDATPKGSADGTELLAVSDSLTAKSITTANIKNYTVAQIEAIVAAGSVTGADGVYILQGGTDLKPVDIDLVAQHAIDIIWAKAAEGTPDDADIMALKDGGTTEKTITLAVLKVWIRDEIEAAILNISDLADGSGALAGSDHMLVTQTGVGNRITFQDVIDGVYAGFAAYVTGLGLATPADADEFYVRNGGIGKKMTLAQIVAHVGTVVTGPGSTTENYIPQWTATNDDLKDGLSLVTASFSGAGVATAVASTQAILNTMDTIIDDAVDIGADLIGADTLLVDDGAAGTQRQSTFTRVWTWILSQFVAVTDVSSYSWVIDEDTMASALDTKVPTQQSVKAYVDSGGGWNGDIDDINLDGGTDIGADLVDADLILVDDGAGGTNRKSVISRIWTYIQGKYAGLTPGLGITQAVGEVCVSNVERVGSLYKTSILVDLTGLHSTGADDIIGDDGTTEDCYIGQITAAVSGTILGGKITCFETPAGGDPDIDLYSAVESTGSEDDLITDLTETKLTNHGDWAIGDEHVFELAAWPVADEYLYLVAGAATDADYTAGRFLIELWGM